MDLLITDMISSVPTPSHLQSQARVAPGTSRGSDALGRIEPAVVARDCIGVPWNGEAPLRPCDVFGLEP